MTRENPYWLIKTPDTNHGIGTVELDEAITSQRALEVFKEREEHTIKVFGMDASSLSATLVTLRYEEDENGIVQPIVEPVQ